MSFIRAVNVTQTASRVLLQFNLRHIAKHVTTLELLINFTNQNRSLFQFLDLVLDFASIFRWRPTSSAPSATVWRNFASGRTTCTRQQTCWDLFVSVTQSIKMCTIIYCFTFNNRLSCQVKTKCFNLL